MTIYLSSKADKQLKKLPQKMHGFLIDKIKSLGQSSFPANSKKLVNRAGWRVRVGDYRILYTVDFRKKAVTVLSVAHRKDAYR